MAVLDDTLAQLLEHDWDLHVERAGARFGRASSGERERPLWVAVVSRNDFAIEAEGPTPDDAHRALSARIASHVLTTSGRP